MSQSDESVDVSTTSPVPAGVVNSPVGQWFLIDANRWLLAGLLTAGVFLVVLVLGWLGVVGVVAEGPATLLLSVLIGGNVTLVTIVISINQLVLSREFGKPHTLRKHDDGVRRLRDDLKEQADTALIPPQPRGFLRVLVGTVEDHADRIGAEAADADDADYQHRADLFCKRVNASTVQFERVLDEAEFGSFELLASMLYVNSAWLIENTLELRHDRPEGVPEEPFDRMEETLRVFNVTRQYTKTLYVQKEIAALSRLLLYVGFFALVVLSTGMLVYGSTVVAALSPTTMLVWYSGVLAIAFAPVAFLLSYVLRLSAVVSFSPLRNSFITDG